MNVQIGALVNDTVGTLAAVRYIDGSETVAAVIMGTGDGGAHAMIHAVSGCFSPQCCPVGSIIWVSGPASHMQQYAGQPHRCTRRVA